MTRKQFLFGSGVVAGGVVSGWFGAGLLEYMGAGPETPWKSFTPDEAKEFDRLAEELIPADPPAPWNDMQGVSGAHDAKVVRYIDWQMASGRPHEGCLKTYREYLPKTRGLGAAEVEKKHPEFFEMMWKHVQQGFYAHPVHGGNDGYASYRMVGLCGPAVTGRNVPGKANHL